MNEIIDKFLLAGNESMSEMNLRQPGCPANIPGFTYGHDQKCWT